MTHDQLRQLALDALARPMVADHVLALADGVLQLLDVLTPQDIEVLREQEHAIQDVARRIKLGFRGSVEYDEADVREEIQQLLKELYA